MYFTNEQAMAESSALLLYVISDFGSIHRGPVRIIYIIFSSDPFSFKGREEAQISVNITLQFSRNYQAIWRHPRTLENSGWVLAYSSSPNQPVPTICSENFSLKIWREKSFEWRLSRTVKSVHDTHAPTCFTVVNVALSLPLTHAVKKHLQMPLLLTSLHSEECKSCKEQNIPLSCHLGKHMPLFSAIIYTHVILYVTLPQT